MKLRRTKRVLVLGQPYKSDTISGRFLTVISLSRETRGASMGRST